MIILKTWTGLQKVNTNEIVYIESTAHGVRIVLTNDREYESPTTLSEIRRLLSSELFFSVHRCYIVNLALIDEFRSKENFVKLYVNGKTTGIPVARRRKKEFIEAWQKIFSEEE